MSKELVRLTNAIFHKSMDFSKVQRGSKSTKDLIFKNPINYSIKQNSKIAIIGNYKSELLKILYGEYISEPINSRIYPLRNVKPDFKIELLQFVNNSYGHGAINSSGGFTHLGARYEFYKDSEIDEKTKDFICDLSYNSINKEINSLKFEKLTNELRLNGLQDKFINELSNGQFRRARIAKGLYKEPDYLLIDDPFLGLDPIASNIVNNVLGNLDNVTITIGLRIQDNIPEWIEDIILVDENGINLAGSKLELIDELNELKKKHLSLQNELNLKISNEFKLDDNNNNNNNQSIDKTNESIIEMNDVDVKYQGKYIIKSLNWQVKKGEKWHIRGKNGSGKTTLLSLITLDHPQSWNSKIKINGIKRKTGKTNYFDTNNEIGFTSPELHAIFPKNLNLIQSIATGYKVGDFLPTNNLNSNQIEKINKYLELIGLIDKKNYLFKDLTISEQKLILLIRSIIKKPKILILDESLSGMTDEDIIKGKAIINQYNNGCVLIIGHVDHEIPKCDKFILLNKANDGIYDIGLVE